MSQFTSTACAVIRACLPWLAAAAGLGPTTALAEQRFDLDETYPIAADGTIDLTTRDAEVTIIGSDRDDVHVEIHWRRTITGISSHEADFRVDVTESDAGLRIEEALRDRTNITVGMVRTRYEVLIEAPAAVSLRIDGDDDDYDIIGIHGTIALAADDGDIRLRDCQGDDFDLEFEDGTLEMDRGRGSLRLRYDDGAADLQGAAFATVRMQANDGTLRLAGDLAEQGRYQFSLDDGDADLQLGASAGGEFTFTMADGSLDLEGGRGSVEVRYDDGAVVLRDGRFERLEVRAADGTFEYDGAVPPGARYGIRLDDGDVRFTAHGGGGVVTARFDDGNVVAQDGFRAISDAEHAATYQWGEGDAAVDIDFNDGRARLAAP